MAISRYFLGGPAWGFEPWIGELYPHGAKPEDLLGQYASVFNAVEGNTTFYGIPEPSTVARWAERTPPHFRFCFKFPKTISHVRQLYEAGAEARLFVRRVEPLAERLGPIFLNLPPGFSPAGLLRLAEFLRELPAGLRYAVEPRHPSFFGDTDATRRLDDILAAAQVDRVMLDARPIHDADHPPRVVVARRSRKPRLPVVPVATGPHPFLRYIGLPDPEANAPWLEPWVEAVAAWIEQGREPYVFIHCPDDFFTPRLARHFHARLADRIDVGTMPPWPAEAASAANQLSLF